MFSWSLSTQQNVVIMVQRGASGLREAIRGSLLPSSSQRAGGIIKLTGYLSTCSSAFNQQTQLLLKLCNPHGS